MKWIDLLPKSVAEHQAAWERRHAVLRAYESGASMRDIAKIMGIVVSRVHQLTTKAHRERRTGKTPPIESFLKKKDRPPSLTSRQRAKIKAADDEANP